MQARLRSTARDHERLVTTHAADRIVVHLRRLAIYSNEVMSSDVTESILRLYEVSFFVHSNCCMVSFLCRCPDDDARILVGNESSKAISEYIGKKDIHLEPFQRYDSHKLHGK